MAIFDSTLQPHLPTFRADRTLLLSTLSIWLIMVFLFSVSDYIDGQRFGRGLPYWLHLRDWGLGFVPWLFMMPVVYLYGARDVNRDLLPSAITAVAAAAIALSLSGIWNAFTFAALYNRTPLEIVSGYTIQGWLWDFLLLIFNYVAGRQMRPRPEIAPRNPAKESAIAVKSQTGVEFVPVRDIQGATAQGNYIALLMDGREVLHRATMATLSDKLSDEGFIRVHRSHLINPNQVTSAKARGDRIREVHLNNGTRIPVSDRYMDDAYRALSGRVVD